VILTFWDVVNHVAYDKWTEWTMNPEVSGYPLTLSQIDCATMKLGCTSLLMHLNNYYLIIHKKSTTDVHVLLLQ